MDLSIIIVNWNSTDYLRACLGSIYRFVRGIEFEVIVVDNASNDPCEHMLRQEFPGVIFVQSGANLGFARANNLGFSHSTGEILLFLNPDTEVSDDSIVKMVHRLRATEGAAAAGARLLNTDGSLQTSCVQSFPTIANQLLDFDFLRRKFPTSRLWGTRALYRTDNRPAEVDALSGACFMMKRSIFERVGKFTETYFMYSDDLDLSYKIRKAGYRAIYLNDCTITHHGEKSSEKREDNFADLWQRESLAQFFRQAHGRVYSATYRVAMACIAALRVGLALCLVAFGKSGFGNKRPASVLKKWSRIFRWAIGLEARQIRAEAR
ncbi:MAG TPA: glycosyltransferase [Methylomirabilota bacterium]|jgi:hypothetical protein|nr:glycosyltransferase [Methylomirabilota bacterium]